MSRSNKLPFPRGRAAFHNDSDNVTVTSLAHLEGQIVYLTDSAVGAKNRRSNADVVAKIVRNVEGSALAAGTAVVYTSTYWGHRVEAADAGADTRVDGFVDDHIPSGGVQNNDLFYMIIEGPCTCVTLNTGGVVHSGSQFDQGGLMALSATSGKITGDSVIGSADGTDAAPVFNVVGRVITTVTEATGTALVDVKLK